MASALLLLLLLLLRRDVTSQGTLKAAIAAGNYGVPFKGGILSGMAPRARIAAYKVCRWRHFKAAATTDTGSTLAFNHSSQI
jgi:hypothetical protein